MPEYSGDRSKAIRWLFPPEFKQLRLFITPQSSRALARTSASRGDRTDVFCARDAIIGMDRDEIRFAMNYNKAVCSGTEFAPSYVIITQCRMKRRNIIAHAAASSRCFVARREAWKINKILSLLGPLMSLYYL